MSATWAYEGPQGSLLKKAPVLDGGEWERAKLTALERAYLGEHHANVVILRINIRTPIKVL